MLIDPKKLVGEFIDNKYRLAEHRGSGGYGVVYAADVEVLGEVVGEAAVKLMRLTPQNHASVTGEIEALHRHNHPRLLSSKGQGEVRDGLAAGCVYVAMELASGTLADATKRTTMAPDELRIAAEHLIEALVHLHDQNYVHRDIKPSNLFRMKDGWKLGDFGLLVSLDDPGRQGLKATSATIVRTGTKSSAKGTALYMAPEYVIDKQYSTACDVWGLGVLLQECLTYKFPYEPSSNGNAEVDIIRAMLRDEPRVEVDLPQPFKHIVSECLRKDPKDRISARQALEMLAPTPIHVTASSPATALPNPRRAISLEWHRGWISAVGLAPDGGALATGGTDGKIAYWNLADMEAGRSEPAWKLNLVAPVSLVQFSPDGTRLAVGAWHGKVRHIRLDTRLTDSSHTFSYAVDCATFSRDGSLFVGLRNGQILSDRNGLVEPLQSLSDGTWRSGPLTGMTLSPDESQLAVGSRNGLYIVDLKSGACTHHLQGKVVRCPLWTKSGQQPSLAVAVDRLVEVLDADKRTAQRLSGHAGKVRVAAGSPDGLLVSGDESGQLIFWDVQSGQNKQVIKEHREPLTALCVCADNRLLVSGDADGRCIVWRF